LDRRLEAAQKASPTKRRQESLQRDLTRVHKSIERLMTAYQEDLLSLDELRSRMPDLRQRERAMQAELQSMATQTQDRSAYLRLAETLSAFLSRMRSSAKTLEVTERQRIVRLLVKEILVGEDAIVIRHSVHPITFEACSGFTRVTARQIAQPPKVTFVTRLQSRQSPSETARQLPDLSTIIWLEPSSNDHSRLQAPLPFRHIPLLLL